MCKVSVFLLFLRSMNFTSWLLLLNYIFLLSIECLLLLRLLKLNYSIEELISMASILSESQRNYLLANRICMQSYSNRNHLRKTTFKCLKQRLKARSVNDLLIKRRYPTRSRTVTTKENKLQNKISFFLIKFSSIKYFCE